VVDDFIERCARLDGAQLGDAVFGDGIAVWVGQREIVHAHGEAIVEIRLTKTEIRARRDGLRADGRVTLRKTASDWLEFEIASKTDEDDALELVTIAIAVNAETASPGLPPTGADLARRRRFH